MISSLDHSSVPWQDAPRLNARKTTAAQKADEASLYTEAADGDKAIQSFVKDLGLAAAPSLDNGINSALYAAAVKVPALREIEARGLESKDTDLLIIHSNPDGDDTSAYTTNKVEGSTPEAPIVYVETTRLGVKRGYEVSVSDVDLSNCTYIEALAVFSAMCDEVAAIDDGVSSLGVRYSKCLYGSLYDISLGETVADDRRKDDLEWDERFNFIAVAQKYIDHLASPLERRPQSTIDAGSPQEQLMQIADKIGYLVEQNEKLPPDERVLWIDGWTEPSYLKYPQDQEAGQMTVKGAAVKRHLDISAFTRRAEHGVHDAWQDLFDSRDEDDENRA